MSFKTDLCYLVTSMNLLIGLFGTIITKKFLNNIFIFAFLSKGQNKCGTSINQDCYNFASSSYDPKNKMELVRLQ
jgi:hypothetical protein